MASAARSTSAEVHIEQKPSFAKIAAAGIKSPNTQQASQTNTNTNHNHVLPSPPRDGVTTVTPSSADVQPTVAPKPKKIVQLASKETRKETNTDTSGPQVRVQIVESVPQQLDEPGHEGLLVPSSDDVGTQISSSSGSNKPQSLDGKSVASGTTFALDEKDSLRPDDSASVKAVEEDDIFAPLGSGMPDSLIGSDDGVRAFRDQLREISDMEPQPRGGPPTPYGHPARGVLYVPPPGPGIGPVPSTARLAPEVPPNADVFPDQKLLEALESPRDRVWVLKLEQDVIDFVKDPKESSLILPQCHSFYRLLAHKMADYYMLGHHVEDASAAVRLYKTEHCRIPPPLTGVTAPSTAASTPPPSAPQMKILRRGVDKSGLSTANGSNVPSKNGSENGDSGEDEKKPKAPVTREEREARYEAARLRIMGSAKPTESSEAPKEKQESRSSSANGKKNKKKQRSDSEDGFEARSAYSNYYTAPYAPEAASSTPYGYSEYSDPGTAHYPSFQGQATQTGGMQQWPMQTSGVSQWPQQSYQTVDPTQAWAQSQSGAYDLAADFQRSMSFQNQARPQVQTMNSNSSYGQQYYGAQQAWSQPQQQYQAPPQVNQAVYGYGQSFTSQAAPMQSDQPYAYGQLPSQTIPGRPPSKLEHPLPGSYKGKNFNPQSQAFIPGQANPGSFTPHGTPSTPSAYAANFGGPAQLQRQNSAQSHGSGFSSPHLNPPHLMQNRMQAPPMTHPLPQGPVFPRQPSPSLPLPPKPGSMPQQIQQIHPTLSNVPNAHGQSLLAKWGAPASLPAKPPPTQEPYDSSKLAQAQRQQYTSAAAAARQPGGFPAFGSMPPAGSAQIVNGSGGQSTRRS